MTARYLTKITTRFVSVYTGYLDVDEGAKHLFFYFFESRRNPEKGMPAMELVVLILRDFTDDVIMWINGGLLDEYPPLFLI